ncbi:MAG: DUF1152 domain-containing protein [Anaerolineae bacterium]|nr:DUF1152 domain-containing protein [Anaerolineae bacterium]
MLTLPFFDEIRDAENILLAGAGGGYDIFCGLPLYFGLRAEGKNVYLANLSFSFLPPPGVVGADRLSESMLRVTADTPLFTHYFPEMFLAQWFREQGEEVTIYCFERTGVKPLLAGYQTLIERLALDTVILVDGGTDSLMRGDESGLGTPHEDIASITAVSQLELDRKLLLCLGFGVDYFHGVCNAHFLEAVAELIQSQGYLGMFSLVDDMPEAQKYRAATEAVFESMAHHISIVSSSILSALAGHYGNYHATSRTRGSTLWINPLMPVYWCFQLAQVAKRVLYLEEMKETDTYDDINRVIKRFRQNCDSIRKPQAIPV